MHPEVLVQLRDELVADAEGFNAHRRQHESTWKGEGAKVRRSPQAVACRKRNAVELRKPQSAPDVWTARLWHTAIEVQMGKPGNETRLEPNALPEKHEPGRRETATRPWGVLSGIVLGAWESHAQGEGPDGSTQRA